LPSLLDAVALTAAETLLIEPGNSGQTGLHGVTIGLGYRTGLSLVRDDRIRRLLALQACSFGPVLRVGYNPRLAPDVIADTRIDQLEGSPGGSVEEAFALLGTDPMQAAAMTLDLAGSAGGRAAFLDRMSTSVFEYADRPDRTHDFKFNEAVARTMELVQDQWAPLLLSGLMTNSHPTDSPKWPRLEEARALLDGN
jgi:hypothetical protein